MPIRIIALFLLLVSVAYGQTPKPKATLQSEINSSFPDNTTGLITPSIVRGVFGDFVASWQQYSGVNAQVGVTYTIQASDYGQLVTFNNVSAVAVTLPQANGSFSTFNFYVTNLSTGLVTITPTTSTINGSSTLTIGAGGSAWIVSDGTNWQVWNGGSSYIQGSWTPTLVGSTSGSWALGTATGTYEKIGRNITVRFTLQASSALTPLGVVRVGSLPFTSTVTANDNGSCSFPNYGAWSGASGYTALSGYITPNTSFISLIATGSTKVATPVNVSELSNSMVIVGTCNYHTP